MVLNVPCNYICHTSPVSKYLMVQRLWTLLSCNTVLTFIMFQFAVVLVCVCRHRWIVNSWPKHPVYLFFLFFPKSVMLLCLHWLQLSNYHTLFFRLVKYSIPLISITISSSCVIALPEECLSGQLWYLLTQMSLHTSQGYLLLQQWARWHPVTIIQSRRSKKPELTKAKSCNILPKVFAPLPSHAYEFEWHPILNPSKADSLQL